MKDGLYRVATPYFVAGFVVEGGRVRTSNCAPILRKKLAYWKTKAALIGAPATPDQGDDGGLR